METAWDASLNLKRLFTDIDKAHRWDSKPGTCLMCGRIETRAADQVCAVCKVEARALERLRRGDVGELVFYHGGKFKTGRTRAAYAGA